MKMFNFGYLSDGRLPNQNGNGEREFRLKPFLIERHLLHCHYLLFKNWPHNQSIWSLQTSITMHIFPPIGKYTLCIRHERCLAYTALFFFQMTYYYTFNFVLFQSYILSSVWIRLSMFSQWSIIQSIIQYVGLCVFSLPTPSVMIERIYILCLIIISKSEVWTTTHCLGLGHETMVCTVCLSIFLWHY